MRILLIEDEPVTARAIEAILKVQRLIVDTTALGEDGLELGKLYDYDVILLDLNLPDMHGYDVLRKLRGARITTPVLILSGANDVDSKIRAFSLGADEYLTKPFQRKELIARIHAIIRRSRGHAQSTLKIGNLSVDLSTKAVDADGVRVHLTGREYAVLEILMLRKGTMLTRDTLLNHLYGSMDAPDMKIIEVFISNLRKKLRDACGGVNYIETVWGSGFRLDDNNANYLSNRVAA